MKEDEESEDLEDMTINPTDSVIVCARNGDDGNQLEACIDLLKNYCFCVL